MPRIGFARSWPARTRALAGTVVTMLVAGLLSVTAMAAPATAETNTAPAYGTGANTFYAYVGDGESLDVDFTVAFENAAADLGFEVTDPSGAVVWTSEQPTGAPVGASSGTAGLTGAAGAWKITVTTSDPNQYLGAYDWSIDVVAGGADAPGRVWSNLYRMQQDNVAAESGDFRYWLVNDTGYVYDTTFNEYNGVFSYISADAVGNVGTDGGCDALYRSVEYSSNEEEAALPAAGDCGTYRIFFDEPSADLPATAPSADGTLVVLPAALTETDLAVDDLAFAPTSSKSAAGAFTWSLTDRFVGAYQLQIDTDGNGSYDDAVDRTVQLAADGSGQYSYDFDGLDGTGAAIEDCAAMNARIFYDRVGEIHLVNRDVEGRAGGVQVVRTNGDGAPDATIYWDDTQVTDPRNNTTTPGPDGTAGLDSTGGVHAWGYDGASWGNNRLIDDWAYNPIALGTGEISIPGNCLAVEKSSSAGETTLANTTVTYTIDVTNVGDSDYTADAPATLTDDLSDVLDDATYNDDVAVSFSGDSTSDAPVVDGTTLTWSGPLAVGETATITYSVVLNGDGDRTVINNACIPEGDAQDSAAACDSTETEIPEDPPPFACTPDGYLFQTLNPPAGPTLQRIVDMGSGQYTDGFSLAGYMNAFAYNPQDDYVYAWANAEQLVRIGEDGSVVELGVPEGMQGAGFNTATFSEDGLLWIAAGANVPVVWNSVDLRPGSPTYMQVLDSGSFTLPTNGVIGDWAFSREDGSLYTLVGTDLEAGTDTLLMKFDTATGELSTVQNLGVLAAPNGQRVSNGFGAVYGDVAGFIYSQDNATGQIWRTDPATGETNFFSYGPPSGNNDGARCVLAAVPVDFGDAPASYGTLLEDDGPRHSIPGFDASNNTAPLMIGSTIDIDTDGVPSDAADGDDQADTDDEDGIGRIEVSPTSPTVTVSATNNTDQPATLAGWIDLDGNGTFEESERVTVTVPAGSGTAEYTLDFPEITADGDTYARFRLFPGEVEDPSSTGTAAAGEVEDYLVHTRALEIEKTSDTADGVRVGDTVTYTLEVTNIGGSAYTEDDPARIQDDLSGVLDDAAYNDDATASSGTVSYAEPRLTWSGALAGGETATITYTVTLTAGGDGHVDNVAFQTDCEADDPDCAPTPPPLEECVDGGVDPETGLPCDEESFLIPNLSIEKTADTTELPRVGDTVTYTVTATNDGPGDYTAENPAVVLDDLTDVLDDATFDEGSLAASVGDVPTYEAPLIGWTGPLAAGESVEITYEVTYTGTGDSRLVNTAWEPSDPENPESPVCDPRDENGLDPETGEACGHVEIPAASLEVIKSVDPEDGTTVTAGQLLTYTLTFANSGSAAAAVEGWTDDLAGVLDDAEVTAAPTASDAGLQVTEIADGRFTVDGSVAAGASYTVTYSVTVLPDGERGDNILDNYVLEPGEEEPPADCEEGDALCTVNPVPEIVSSKSANPDSGSTVQPGQEITYTLTFENIGEAAGAVDQVDDLTHLLDDADITSAPASSDDALTVSEIADGRFSITGALAAGQTVTVTYTATLKAADELGDAQVANFLLEDPTTPTPEDPEDCEPGDEDCTIHLVPRLEDSKSADPESGSTVQPGQEITYTLTFTNTGTAPASVVRADDLTHLLDDADITSAPAASDDALTVSEIEDGRFSIVGSLDPGQTVTVSYTATVKAADQLGDTALANFLLNPDDPTPDPEDCEPGDEDCTEHFAGRLEDAKSADPESGSTVQPGQAVTYTLTFTNTGSVPVGVDRVDDLNHVLDDADVTAAPASSDDALTVSELAGGRFTTTGSLEPGQTVTVSYTATVKAADELGDKVLANFLLDPDQPTPENPEDCEPGEEDCTIHEVPQIVSSKSVDPESGTVVAPGQELTYTLTFTNIGEATGDVDEIDDLTHLLDDADITSAPAASDDALAVSEIADDRFSITGELAAGQTATVSYKATVKAAEDLGDTKVANFLLENGPTPPPTPENPEDCEPGDPDCTDNDVPRIEDSKSADPISGTSVKSGQAVTYTLTFTNTGAAAGEVDRVDDLTHVLDDADVTSAPAASDPALTVSAIEDGRFSTTGELAPGQTVTVSYTVTVKDAAQLGDELLANFLLDPTDPTPEDPQECQPGDEDCTIHQVSDITVVKSADPASGADVEDGQRIAYTLTFVNTGEATGEVAYTDHMAEVLDDADLTDRPVASDDALVVSDVADDAFSVSGELAAGQTVMIAYAVTVRDWDAQGDHVLGNFVTVTGQEPPSECISGSPLCTVHYADEPVVPAPGRGLASTGMSLGTMPTLLTALGLIGAGAALVAIRRRRSGRRVSESEDRGIDLLG